MQNAHLSPNQKDIKAHPLRFTASGSEYLRIWGVNLLLVVLTLGIYYPWAKARRIRYFSNNTELKGHRLDFRSRPSRMLKGNILVGVLLLLCYKAMEIAGLAPLVAVLGLVVLGPALYRASMQSRLGNTSWCGVRFHFQGDLPGAYLSVGIMCTLALLPFGIKDALVMMTTDGVGIADLVRQMPLRLAVAALVLLVMVAGLPYLLWRIKCYQHGNYAYGALSMQFRCTAWAFYGMSYKAVGFAALGVVMLPLVVWAGVSVLRSDLSKWLILVLAALYLLYYAFARSYWRVSMQNLAWSRTGNSRMRFVSHLRFREYAKLQLRNSILIVCTLGLYWPFAVVASRRMEVEAIELLVRVGTLERLVAKARQGDAGTVGDATADLFGLDVAL